MADESLADAVHEHQGKLAAFNFLVLRHQPHQCLWRRRGAGDRGDLHRKADGGEVPLNPGGVFSRTKPEFDREGEGEPHADRDRLTMQ